MNKARTIILILMALVTVLVVALALLVLARPGGPLEALISSPEAKKLGVYVNAPQYASIGEDFKLLVTVENRSERIVKIDELRLSKTITDVAQVTGIFPGLLSPRVEEDYTAYPIGMLLEAGKRLDIEVSLKPQALADLTGEVIVTAAGQEVGSGLRMVFAHLALLTETTPLPTNTPQPTFTPTLSPPTATPTATLPPPLPYLAVVKLIAKQNQNGKLRDISGGSGVIISPDGLIITNAHVATPPNRFVTFDAIAVMVAESPEQAPVEKYYAEVLQADTTLDVAVLRIVTDINRRPVDPANLNLPFALVGDSDQLKLGDPLRVLGYPLIGGSTITLTMGEVAGFTPDSKLGPRAWIKTTAAVAAGTSGGMVLDANGFLVAIPTAIGYGSKRADPVDCRPVMDSNGDGDIDGQDFCVTVGGFINALRPINLAKDLIAAARAAMTGGGAALTPTPTPTPTP